MEEVHWGGAVLPPGEYVVSVSADAIPVVTVCPKGGASNAMIAAKAVSSEPFSGNSRVVINNSEAGNYVTSLYVQDSGTMLTFAAPGAKPDVPDNANLQVSVRQDSARGESILTDSGLFAVRSLGNQTAPQAAAEAIYLSACKVVEQEYSQTDLVRPKLTLLLGAGADGVNYPKREIQLRKWDKYLFAEGVVLLAVDELLPKDKRLSLTKLAVLEAESTVDLSALKNSRTTPQAHPQN